MRIKEIKKSELPSHIKNFLSVVCKKIFNKKIKIILLIFLFLMGTLFGILASGFFGTFDEPSVRALAIVHSTGLYNRINLGNIRETMKGILKENVKIPFNYIRGQFSNPEKISIEIDFMDYRLIEYKRQQALERGILLASPEDYVPAIIRYEDKELRTRIRLKGDKIDHLQGNKWSFRIKVRNDDTLFGMKAFSIQTPRTRDYLTEFIYHQTLKREDIPALRYKFIEVSINGKNKGIYAVEEHFDTKLIADNNRIEGIIIKFDDDWKIEEFLRGEDYFVNSLNNSDFDFFMSNIETFDNQEILNDPIFSEQFKKARNLLESFKQGDLQTNEVFDIDKFAKYFALNTLLGAEHASHWGNLRFYYNPITSKLEPIGAQAENEVLTYQSMEEYFPDCISDYNICAKKSTDFYNLIFRDKIFFIRYMQELEKVSQEAYLDELFLELEEEINKNKNIIHKDKPSYHFSKNIYYENQRKIKERLNPVKSVNVYLHNSLPTQNKIIIVVKNIDSIPLEISNLIYNNSTTLKLVQGSNVIQPRDFSNAGEYQKFEFAIPPGTHLVNLTSSIFELEYGVLGLKESKRVPVFPWSPEEEDFLEKDFIIQNSNFSFFEDALEIDESSKIIKIKKGIWTLNQSLILPKDFSVFASEGVILNLINGATILSYSNLQFVGTEQKPIKIISSDGTGQGLTVLNANRESNLEYVSFENLNAPSKEGWELSGAITFYESPVKFNNVKISGINSEDSLNLVRSKFEITNSIFGNCFSDCLDIDFSDGVIENSLFTDCGNDCVDISGSVVNLNRIEIVNAADKGISLGEKSDVTMEYIQIDNTYIGVASKDLSKGNINEIEITNCEYGFAVYQKKSEFGPAEIKVIQTTFLSNKNDYFIEKESDFSLNDKIILGTEEKVYEKLYPL